jgi:Ca2+-binding EF-hand superfamily protein
MFGFIKRRAQGIGNTGQNDNTQTTVDSVRNLLQPYFVNSITNMFKQFDDDNSGTIDQSELLCMIRNLCPDIAHGHVLNAFEAIDTNADGDVRRNFTTLWPT